MLSRVLKSKANIKNFGAVQFRRYSPLNAQLKECENSEPNSSGKANIITNAPGWNEKTASDSEAIVKADRDRKEPIQKLVEKTKEYVKSVYKETAESVSK